MVVVVQKLVDCIPGKYCDNCDRGSFLCLSSRVLSDKKMSVYVVGGCMFRMQE